MSAMKQKRRLGTAALLSLAIIVTLGTMAAATEGHNSAMLSVKNSETKGFCPFHPAGAIQRKCTNGSDIIGTQSGVECKGNPVDC